MQHLNKPLVSFMQSLVQSAHESCDCPVLTEPVNVCISNYQRQLVIVVKCVYSQTGLDSVITELFFGID